MTKGTTTISAQAAPDGRGETRKQLLYARLITLMQLADESAEIAYPRRLHMPDIGRQLIFMIGMYGTAASKDLAIASGREKAQISRGVKALTEAGLIDRAEPRGRISLNAAGRAIYLDVMNIARERDLLLRKGLDDAELARFLAITGTLIDRASSIFVADEQTGVQTGEIAGEIDSAARSSIHHPPEPYADLPRESAQEQSFRDLLLPWLQSLMTYMRRSGTTLFRREVDLSTFEWRVVTLIEENQPINLSSLIALVARDKSQVARVIKQLHSTGLVDRRDEGRVNAALALTAAGRARYNKIFAITVERDAFLFSDLKPDDRAFYFDMLDRLTANASAMLDEERSTRIEAPPVRAGARQAPRAAAPSREDAPSEVQALRAENARLKQLLAEAILENARIRDA